MQMVVKHDLDDGNAYFIHNDQNGHEYKFFVGNDGSVSLQSSSPNGALHEGEIAIKMVDALTSSFAVSFNDFHCIPLLNESIKEARLALSKSK